jgi:hypothetical protein
MNCRKEKALVASNQGCRSENTADCDLVQHHKLRIFEHVVVRRALAHI